MVKEYEPTKGAATDDAQETQRRRVGWLFSKFATADLAQELTDIADFFSFLSERIVPRRLLVKVDADLIERFEPVYLLLLDRLKLYPASIRAQVEDIARQADVCSVMAITGALRRTDSRLTWSTGVWRSLFESISVDLVGIKVVLTDATTIRVNSALLFRLQVALRRLAGLVRYASSIEFVDYDESFRQFKHSYDPDLVDRSKLLALVNILRMEVNTHPTSDEKNLLLSKLEHIEQELKRSKVRWGIVITSFFILFGFLADLKTLKPDVYEKSYKVVQNILSVLHSDGLVSNKPPQLLPDRSTTSPMDAAQEGDDRLEDIALPPKRREDEE